MVGLVEAGKLYLAQPPLYRITQKDTSFYAMTDEDKDRIIKENFKQNTKVDVSRFKGLGEMNPEELWNTTLDPATRNLLQVQYSKDPKKDQGLIHKLMGNDVSLRKDYIFDNALNVQNLDISKIQLKKEKVRRRH